MIFVASFIKTFSIVSISATCFWNLLPKLFPTPCICTCIFKFTQAYQVVNHYVYRIINSVSLFFIRFFFLFCFRLFICFLVFVFIIQIVMVGIACRQISSASNTTYFFLSQARAFLLEECFPYFVKITTKMSSTSVIGWITFRHTSLCHIFFSFCCPILRAMWNLCIFEVFHSIQYLLFIKVLA